MPFAIEPSTEIWHRDDFTVLANWRRLWRAVEVGVERGVWASLFLSRWQGWAFWGVDPFLPYGEMNYPREADYAMALAALQPYADRAKLLRMPSVEAAALFEDGGVDFVYVDGAHDYESVRADLQAWWPKINEIGLIAGHDWTDQEAHAGVKKAVEEFARKTDRTIYLTSPVAGYNSESLPSWYMYKSGMPGSDWRRC